MKNKDKVNWRLTSESDRLDRQMDSQAPQPNTFVAALRALLLVSVFLSFLMVVAFYNPLPW